MLGRTVAIARGFALQVGSRLLSTALAVVTVGLTTQYLGADGYGILVTAIVFTGLFEAFTELGLGTVIVRRVASGQGTLSRLVSVNLGLSIGYAIPLAVLPALLGLVVYQDGMERAAVAILAAGLACSAIATCVDPIFDARIRFGTVAATEVISRLAVLAATAVIILVDGGLLAICAAQLGHGVIRLVGLLYGAGRLERIRPVWDWAETVGLLRESFVLTLILLIGVLYWRVDGVLLSLLADRSQVGAYGLALQLAFTLNVLAMAFSRSAFSTIVESRTRGPDQFRRAVQTSYRFLLFCGVPIAALGVPVAGRVVALIGGEEYVSITTLVLQLFLVALVLGFLTTVVSDALVAAHRQRFLIGLSVANLLLNIGLNVALIPRMGAAATGVALVVTNGIGAVLGMELLRREGAGGLPLSHLVRLLPAVAAGLLLMWLTWRLPVVVPLSAAAVGYLAVAVGTRAVDPAWLRGALRPAAPSPAAAPEPGSEPTPAGPAARGQ